MATELFDEAKELESFIAAHSGAKEAAIMDGPYRFVPGSLYHQLFVTWCNRARLGFSASVAQAIPEGVARQNISIPDDGTVVGWIDKAQGRYAGQLNQTRWLLMKFAEWQRAPKADTSEPASDVVVRVIGSDDLGLMREIDAAIRHTGYKRIGGGNGPDKTMYSQFVLPHARQSAPAPKGSEQRCPKCSLGGMGIPCDRKWKDVKVTAANTEKERACVSCLHGEACHHPSTPPSAERSKNDE